MDTADGIFMTNAYNWAFATSLRKMYYNLSVTGISLIIALIIGLVEITQLLTEKLNLNTGVWHLIQELDFSNMGYLLVILFILTWGFSFMFWRISSQPPQYKSSR